MLNLCDPRTIKQVMDMFGLNFKKEFGQNFLTDNMTVEDIADACNDDKDITVVEIGPGIGPLTQQLCLRAKKVCAVELDQRLKPILDLTVGEFDNLEIVWDDILKQNVAKLVEEKFAGLHPFACANLPYYITSPILSALLEAECFEAVTVMVQKEVALRIAAKPGTADYSAFTVFCQFYAEPELLFDVPAHCFMPQPKVTSAVITLRTRKELPWDVLDEKIFFRVVRASFAMRRKTLQNGLASGFPELGKAGAGAVIEACGLPASVRGETLDIPQFAKSANEIVRRRNQNV